LCAVSPFRPLHLKRYDSRPVARFEAPKLRIHLCRWGIRLEPEIVGRAPADGVRILAFLERLGCESQASILDFALPRVIGPWLAVRQHRAHADVRYGRHTHRNAERANPTLAVHVVDCVLVAKVAMLNQLSRGNRE